MTTREVALQNVRLRLKVVLADSSALLTDQQSIAVFNELWDALENLETRLERLEVEKP